MITGAAIITSSELLLIIRPSNLAAVYQVNDHGLFWIMDDKELRLGILSIQFWWEGSAIISYFLILDTYICLYNSYKTFIRHLCSKANMIVVIKQTLDQVSKGISHNNTKQITDVQIYRVRYMGWSCGLDY